MRKFVLVGVETGHRLALSRIRAPSTFSGDFDVHDTSHRARPDPTFGMGRAPQIAQRRETAVIEGVITTKHVIVNASLIVRSYGIRTWVSCIGALLSRRPTTFLALIWSNR